MRDIEFRAWNIKEEIMESTDIRGWSFFGDVVFGCCGDDWIPMQYTGILDKNGTKIFEGDIVKQKHTSIVYGIDANHISEIYTTHVIEYGSYGWDQFFPDSEQSADINASHCEVIGNIYENPELVPISYQQ